MKLVQIKPLRGTTAYVPTQRFKLPEGTQETAIYMNMHVLIGESYQWQLKAKDSNLDASVIIEKNDEGFFGNIECYATAHSFLSVKGRMPLYLNKEFILTSIRSDNSIEFLTWTLLPEKKQKRKGTEGSLRSHFTDKGSTKGQSTKVQ